MRTILSSSPLAERPATESPRPMLPSPLAALVLFLGPALTEALVRLAPAHGVVRPDQVPMILFVAGLFWSPLFFSLPALLLQDVRDAALPSWRGVVGSLARGVVLLPYLVVKGPHRLCTIASLVGWTTFLVLSPEALSFASGLFS